ncbi:hypothetical protein CEG14_24895 [Bordetella genomosp. 1]|uniref:Gfo/Idh/MocA-like oxidoreductase N-terminal domain-containing protein n=1 Tax=Bordetella genomosp. 1 TaxID=1395607 RepID=A0A261RSX4_9BORD|nr:Gfo/Idh/MocA family oxidoreductase [Bordetella genomosp. 1]OZI28154.1 hypothetical protein CEG14_24895 [Bordetella genomosp. 1]
MSGLSVLIIGCGNIAGGFDAERAPDAAPLTHAGAFSEHAGFTLAACVDPDAQRAQAFAQRWSVARAATSLAELAAAPGDFDVISICSPTALHPEHLAAALALRPRLIFCEKPVTPTLAQTREWVQACEAAGVLFAINHTRRWAPDVQRLAAELRAGQWGAVRGVAGQYNKGVLNNGGHMVDLLHALLGELSVVWAGQPIWDFWPDDPTVAAVLRGPAGVNVSLNPAHAADYAYFELQLITERGVITMEDGGMFWRVRRAVDNPHFKGYRSLEAGERQPGEYVLAMRRAVQNIHAALEHGAALESTGHSAMQAQAVCEALKSAALAA